MATMTMAMPTTMASASTATEALARQRRMQATIAWATASTSGEDTTATEEKKPRKKAAAGERWPDVVGAEGPNKLRRMVGGNPKGEKCSKLTETGKCPFKTCSYSHE